MKKAIVLLALAFAAQVQAASLPVAYPIVDDFPALALDRCTRDGCFMEASNTFISMRTLIKQMPIVASANQGPCITGICILEDGHPTGTTIESRQSLSPTLAKR